MKYTDSNDTFENFPLSQRAKDAYRQQILKHHPKGLSTFAFRLAAQETRTRWKNQTSDDHIDHMKHVAYRAVLECFLKEEIEQRDIQQKLTVIYEKNEESFKLIEPITALQVCVQPVLETLIYHDRQMWLIENGYTADIIPVFDENISPRNLALIATRR